MKTPKIDATAVKEILAAVVAEDPDRVDRRAATNSLSPRYAEHGCPACLVGEIMFRLGVKLTVLKEMHETPLGDLRHPVQNKFTEMAWQMMIAIQWCNDRGLAWSHVQESVIDKTSRAWFPWWLERRAWMEEFHG